MSMGKLGNSYEFYWYMRWKRTVLHMNGIFFQRRARYADDTIGTQRDQRYRLSGSVQGKFQIGIGIPSTRWSMCKIIVTFIIFMFCSSRPFIREAARPDCPRNVRGPSSLSSALVSRNLQLSSENRECPWMGRSRGKLVERSPVAELWSPSFYVRWFSSFSSIRPSSRLLCTESNAP